MSLFLLRHGKTEANEKRLYCGSTDISLSPDGIAELKLLKATIDYPKIENYRVITSGMKRCEETLELLYGSIPHETMSELREMDFGGFEMRSYAQLKDDAEYIRWISGDNEANPTPGGESGNIMRRRVFAALDKINAGGRDVFIVTHGGVIAAVMERLFPNEEKNRYEWQPKFGRGYLITASGEEKTYAAVG